MGLEGGKWSLIVLFMHTLWPTEAPNRLQRSDEGLPQQSEHTSRLQAEVRSLAGGQLVSVSAGWLYKGDKTSGVWTSQGKFENVHI